MCVCTVWSPALGTTRGTAACSSWPLPASTLSLALAQEQPAAVAGERRSQQRVQLLQGLMGEYVQAVRQVSG